MGHKLNPKQRVFIQEYLIDMNASKAAVRAGYSKTNSSRIGPELLGKTWVREAVDLAIAEKKKACSVSAEYVINTIKETIERCIQRVPVLDDEGNQIGEWKFEHNGVLKGCELLGRHLGLFMDKIQHSGEIKSGGMSPQEVDQMFEDQEAKQLGRALALRIANKEKVNKE